VLRKLSVALLPERRGNGDRQGAAVDRGQVVDCNPARHADLSLLTGSRSN
jgi:hypothetical protein